MSQRFSMPYAEWINGSSVVQAGAKLYFYASGTTTPQDTYSDSTLATPNTNPVVADSDGRFGSIFLSAANYKVILQTSASVQIWTADPVSSGTTSDTWVVAGGTADALTATYSPAITSLGDGQLCFVRALSANATTTPTFSPSGFTAHTITKLGGVAVAANEWATDQELIFRYKLASTRWELLNPTIYRMAANTVKANTTAATASASDVTFAALALLLPMRNYLTGLTLSAAGSTATFGIAAGAAADSTNAALMSLASAYTKTTSSWTVGSGNGGIDTGAVANSTWYHVYLIQRVDTGVVDVIFSTSASAPTLPTNYTLYRRIGSMKTDGSAQWVKFSQNGDEYLWDVALKDLDNVTVTSTSALKTLTVPTGVKVNALYRAFITGTNLNDGVVFTSPDESDQAASSSGAGIALVIDASGTFAGGQFNTRTNTSAQIRARATTSLAATLNTYGWVDRRGRD